MGGRGRSRRTQRKHFRDGRENVWKKDKPDTQDENNENGSNGNNGNRPTHWQPFAIENAAFDEYYKEQGVVRPEEWDSFIECLRKPLPAAFRINSSSQFCTDIRSQLEDEFMKSLETEATEEKEADGIKPLPWYPDNFAWHSSFSRMQLRKNKNLERFHEFLKQENEIGNITRQEAVSMVPPLFLDVHGNHFVLDMCAAPGSKTFQLLETIHKTSQVDSLPSGMIIANDVDVQRCNLLIHQTKRMCTANLAVTNHEAQHFPSCHMKKNISENEVDCGMTQLLFDRVLCDVPCSGDGTLRKAPDIWKKWSVGMANGVHCLQLQIAMRGLALLKTGGRMVYSTCSMNPVENEAVVSEILRRCGDSVELVDVSTELPQLLRRPGLKSWKVRDKGMWLASYKDACKHGRPGIVSSMFPCGESNGETCQEAADDSTNLQVSSLPLERCMRIVPHDQNTGAFFIAVLHKKSPLPPQINAKNLRHPSPDNKNTIEKPKQSDDVNEMDVENEDDLESNPSKKHKPEPEQKNVKSRAEKANDKRKLQIQGKWFGVDPIVFFNDDKILTNIKEFYGIPDSFPFSHRLITRNNDTNHVKRIYYVSESVMNVVDLNFLSGEQLKITSIGLKMFERQTSREGTSSPCVFRISSEGLPLLLPHMTKQIASATPLDFKHILQYKSVKFQDIVDEKFREKVATISMGCCVVVLNKGNEASSDPPKIDKSTIAIGCWKGRSSLSVMVTAIDCQELLERLLIRLEAEKGDEPQKVVVNEDSETVTLPTVA